MASRRLCNSFHGEIKELPNIFVDNFQTVGKKAYFLSHCHEDHIGGLFNKTFLSYLKESKTFIYMSEISASIINVMSEGSYNTYIKPLKLGSTVITLKSDDSEEAKDLYLKVSLIPAGHCFGSVMFLFRIPNMTILYTGDFRISRNDISRYEMLHKNNKPINIDVMYIDTTFQGKKYEEFPKRSEIVDDAIEEMRKWLDGEREKERCIALHTSARIGYEFVFREIYKQLKIKVSMNPGSRQYYRDFPEMLNVVTLNSESKIHLCSDRRENGCHDRCNVDTFNKEFLYVHFSALKWDNCDINKKMINMNKNRMDVCFATHCSRSELAAFVTYFSPKEIVGFREPFNIDLCPKLGFDDVLEDIPQKKFASERSDAMKVPAYVLKRMFDD